VKEFFKMNTGTTVALGVAIGAAFGASNGNMAMSVAIGTASGAIFGFVIHVFKLAKRKREQAAS
jgi:hypothetical protein